MKFLFDNSVSSNLTAALRLLKPDHAIEHLTDRFPADVLDEVWLRAVVPERGLILISADPTITSSKKQREIWRTTGLTAFFFGSGFAAQRIAARTEEVVRWWPAIVAEAKHAKRGTGYLLPFQARKPRRLYEPFNPRRATV